jgi:murein tripeptide amidase MpaA
MPLSIDASMFGGSIEVVRIPARGSVELALRSDTAADIRQWFCFDVQGATTRSRELVVRGASGATYPKGWDDYRAMVSFDGGAWRRAPTEYDGEDLLIVHEPRGEVARYAYFAQYSLDRLERTLRRVALAGAEVGSLGDSAEGRPLHVAVFGADDAERTFWIVARQHPGETPASWLLEGLLRRLGRSGDDAVEALLATTRICLVPLANPDGAALGNMRTSATGANLNRAWDAPDREESPEIVAILEAIDAMGVDLFLDVHADEDCAHAFAAGCEGNPSYDDELEASEASLRDDLAGLVPEFVDEPFYELDEPGQADLSCAANQIGERHGCVALTLELPIKSSGGGRVRSGWSPKRAERAGAAIVEALLSARARLED